MNASELPPSPRAPMSAATRRHDDLYVPGRATKSAIRGPGAALDPLLPLTISRFGELHRQRSVFASFVQQTISVTADQLGRLTVRAANSITRATARG